MNQQAQMNLPQQHMNMSLPQMNMPLPQMNMQQMMPQIPTNMKIPLDLSAHIPPNPNQKQHTPYVPYRPVKQKRDLDADSASSCSSRGKKKVQETLTESEPWKSTTLMLRNIPNKYTREMLLDELKTRGFIKEIDFFYLPIDLRRQCNLDDPQTWNHGYCFVNVTSTDAIGRFRTAFEGLKLDKVKKSGKVCEVGIGKIQGLEANIEAYRNSVVMLNTECSPMLFKDGEEIRFPAPTGDVQEKPWNKTKKIRGGRKRRKLSPPRMMGMMPGMPMVNMGMPMMNMPMTMPMNMPMNMPMTMNMPMNMPGNNMPPSFMTNVGMPAMPMFP